MTYDADENFTPDKVFILKGEEISDFGVAKQEQLLDLMAEASQLYPDASAQQVIEFAKQRLLTRNVLSNYQEITAPPLPSLLELTAGTSSADEEVAPVQEVEEPEEEWVAPEEVVIETAEEPVEESTEYLTDSEDTPEDASEAAEEPSGESADDADLYGEPEAVEPSQSLPEEPVDEPEYTLEEETDDYIVEGPAGTEPGYSTEPGTGADSAEEESPEEAVQAVEPEEKLVTSYDQAHPSTFRQERRYVGLLEAAGRMDAKGD